MWPISLLGIVYIINCMYNQRCFFLNETNSIYANIQFFWWMNMDDKMGAHRHTTIYYYNGAFVNLLITKNMYLYVIYL